MILVKHHLSSLNRVTLDVSDNLQLETRPPSHAVGSTVLYNFIFSLPLVDLVDVCRVKQPLLPSVPLLRLILSFRTARLSFWPLLVSWPNKFKRSFWPLVTTWTSRSMPVLEERPSVTTSVPFKLVSKSLSEHPVVLPT